jgi:hypothetical protein
MSRVRGKRVLALVGLTPVTVHVAEREEGMLIHATVDGLTYLGEQLAARIGIRGRIQSEVQLEGGPGRPKAFTGQGFLCLEQTVEDIPQLPGDPQGLSLDAVLSLRHRPLFPPAPAGSGGTLLAGAGGAVRGVMCVRVFHRSLLSALSFPRGCGTGDGHCTCGAVHYQAGGLGVQMPMRFYRTFRCRFRM